MATGITGRLVRRTTKEPLQGVGVEAINASTGVSASTTTTTDTEGLFEISGLTSAVYFAKPLVSGDDWDLLPNIAEIYTDEIHVAADGQLLIDGTATAAGAVIPLRETVTRSAGGGDTTGFRIELTRSGTATGGMTGLYSLLQKTDSNNDASSSTVAVRGEYQPASASGTVTQAIGVEGQINLIAGGGGLTISDARAVYGIISGGSGTITTSVGVYADVSVGTNQRGIVIANPSSGANNYAIYSSAGAQSVHAGNLRIGSTTAPTAALHVTGDGLFDPSTAGEATLALNNGSSNSAAATTISMSVPATSTGDLKWNATIASTKAWSWGIDNSDSDAWVLSENASLGSSNRIRTVGSLVELLTTAKATANGWYIKGGSASYGSDTAGVLLDMAFDTADTDLAINAIHSATTGAGNAVFTLSTHPSGTGDPQVHFRISGTQSWRVGVDNSASDAFIISRGSALGTNNVLSISTGDVITLSDAVNIAVNTSTGTKIGTATTQKLGFFNATPVVRQTAPAAAPAGGTGVAAGGWSSATNRDTAINCINGIRTALINLGLIG